MTKITRISEQDLALVKEVSSITGLDSATIIKLALSAWKGTKEYSQLILEQKK